MIGKSTQWHQSEQDAGKQHEKGSREKGWFVFDSANTAGTSKREEEQHEICRSDDDEKDQ